MAGNGGFSVVITAVDAASAKIDAINKKIESMRAPAERVQKSLSRFADVSGLNAVGKGVGKIAHASLEAFRSLARMVAPLGAITGALSVAGIARLATAWGAFGERLNIASQRANMSAERLHTLQGAARLSGASAEAMTSGLRTLADTLTDAVGGRAPEAVVMMNTLGISFRDASGHARNTADVLPEIADKIAAIKNPSLQARVAVQLLGAAGEELLPALRRGRKGLEEYTEEARHYGVMNDSAARTAQELAREQHRLELATEGLTLSIGEALAPVLGPMLHDMAEWIAANRQWIATDIASGVKKLADEVKFLSGQFNSAQSAGAAVAAYFAGPWLVAMMLGLSPVRAAIFAIVAGLALIHSSQNNGPAAYAVGSPLWDGMSEQEQGNYVNSPRSQEFLRSTRGGGSNPYPFSIWNPGSWRGHGELPPNPPPAVSPNGVPRVGPTFGPQMPGSGARPDTTGSLKTESMTIAHDYFRSQGWDEAQTAGLQGFLRGESGKNLDTNAFNPDKGGQGAQGIDQWRGDRINRYRAMYGHDPRGAPLKEQLEYIQWELTHTESKTGNALRNIHEPGEAAFMITRDFGRPTLAEYPTILPERAGYAREYFNAFGNQPANVASGSGPTVPNANITNGGGGPPANIGGGTGAAPAEVNHTVRGDASLKITLGGAVPTGTTTSTTASGDLWGGAPRVERAMTGPPT